LGLALRADFGSYGRVEFASRSDLDLADPGLCDARPWREYDTVVNAAAYTAVDAAETPAGRAEAWATNVSAVRALAQIATAHRLTLVHLSSDYVFDGTSRCYREDDPPAPLGVYGQTKAAGDAIVATVPRHYLLRTSWVIGDGHNFVRTMAGLAERGVDPSVVNDQIGRPTFTPGLARAIGHLLATGAPYGTYNVTGAGRAVSWYDIATRVFSLVGADPSRVRPVTTVEYYAGASGPVAPRPLSSVLSLDKIRATGFEPEDWEQGLAQYVR
jgi:dTDP-4-dehydrorhamnose 3,5-epimerase